MGFNVQGIATSIRTENVSELMHLLGMDTPTEVDTTHFENATSSFIEDNELFLTVAAKGTILIVGDKVPIHDVSLERLSMSGKALKFMVGETSMVFAFDYYESGKLVRSIVNAEDQIIQEEGSSLEIEQTEADFTEIIFSIMDEVAGGSIYSLEPDTKSVRYKFSDSFDKVNAAIEPAHPAHAFENNDQNFNTKKWWQFWK